MQYISLKYGDTQIKKRL